jgi:hypothetical protein
METDWVDAAIEKATVLLTKWRMGKVKLWDYTPTHFKMTLRVESTDIPGNLHIVCGGCSYFSGPFFWRDCDLRVERQAERDGGIVLLDEKANFGLHCRVVSVEENVEPVYSPNLGVSPG